MEEPIAASQLNDFIFCPMSLYYHRLFGVRNEMTYQSTIQINGTIAHKSVDNGTYSCKHNILTGIEGISNRFNLICRIDIYNIKEKTIIERKKKITKIFDGHIFQVYSQFFALTEMGYDVEKTVIHSLDDNKNYYIPLPNEDLKKYRKFVNTLREMYLFEIDTFFQDNLKKCLKCIYEPICDRSLVESDLC